MATLSEDDLMSRCETIVYLYEDNGINNLNDKQRYEYLQHKKTLELIKELKEYRNKENNDSIDYENGYIRGIDDFTEWFLNNFEDYEANNVHKTFRELLNHMVSIFKQRHIKYRFNIGDWVECKNIYESQILKSIFLGEDNGFYWILNPKSKVPTSLGKDRWRLFKIKNYKIDFDGALEVVK